jgi:hypothetical protein
VGKVEHVELDSLNKCHIKMLTSFSLSLRYV